MCHTHRSPQRRRPVASGDRLRAAEQGPPTLLSQPVRVALFLALAGIVVLTVGLLLWPRARSAGVADQTLQVTMGGFSPPVVTARAGEPLRLRLVNPDSPFHTDGGGWHQLAIPGLGVDARVAPRGDTLVAIPAPLAGEYAFYCDICCGGKENPSMRGTLRVTA